MCLFSCAAEKELFDGSAIPALIIDGSPWGLQQEAARESAGLSREVRFLQSFL